MLCSDVDLPNSPIEPLFARLCIWLGDLGIPCCTSEVELEFALTLQDAVYRTVMTATPEDSIHIALRVAHQKLMDTHTPLLLRVTTYLRLCCLVVQHTILRDRFTVSNELYFKLVQSLQVRDPEWWVNCTITEDGLSFSNPHIQELLHPLLNFIRELKLCF